MSVFDSVFAQLARQAKGLVIGYPSEGLGKATGLYYSVEYYEKEMNNKSRSDFHRMNAKIAYEVLSSKDLHEHIAQMIETVAKDIGQRAYDISGVLSEETEQANNDAKIIKPVRKASVKRSVAKPAAKVVGKTVKATTAKTRAKASSK